MEKICQNCNYFIVSRFNRPLCNRFPPVLGAAKNWDFASVKVPAEMFCGEFKFKNESVLHFHNNPK